jgi:hypothetical protein
MCNIRRLSRDVVFARELRHQEVELEGDALQIVHVLKKEMNNWCKYDQLIEDARIILDSLRFWNMHYVGREANVVAHKLASQENAFSYGRTSPYGGSLSLYSWHYSCGTQYSCLFTLMKGRRDRILIKKKRKKVGSNTHSKVYVKKKKKKKKI